MIIKRYRRMLAALLALLTVATVLSLPATSAAASRKVRVGIFDDTLNYFIVGEDGELGGYGYDYLQELAQHAGWRYEYVFASHDECVQMLADGEIDLLGALNKDSERMKVLDYADLESGISSALLHVRAENDEIFFEDFEAFSGMTVGMVRSFSQKDVFYEYARARGFTFTGMYYTSQKAMLDALELGEIDALLTSDMMNVPDSRVVAKLSPVPIYFTTTKGNTQILEELNAAQSAIKTINPYFDLELYSEHSIEGGMHISLSEAEREFVKETGAVRVAMEVSRLPYSEYNSETNSFSGILPDLLELITEQTGLEFELIPASDHVGAQEMLSTGGVDLISCYEHNYAKAAKKNFYISSVYITVPMMLLRSKGVTEVDGLDVVYAVRNQVIDLSEEFEKASSVIGRPTSEEALLAIRNGLANATYMNSHSANVYLNDSRFYELSQTVLDGVRLDLCFASRDVSGNMLISIIDKAIAGMSSSQMNEFVLAHSSSGGALSVTDVLNRLTPTTAVFFLIIIALIICMLSAALILMSRSNRRVRRLLNYDTLTGLPSGSHFIRAAKEIIDSAPDANFALLYLDVNRFKFINETYGYSEGDRLLKDIAEMLREMVGKGELASRSYADNFSALLRFDTSEALYARLEDSELVKETAFHNRAAGYRVTLSTGLYIIKEHDISLDACVVHAHYAKDLAKGAYTNALVTYEDRIKTDIEREKSLENKMHAALENGEFVPYFQAKTNINTGETIGAEALARWMTPDGKMVSPGEFIPFFEKCGFIVQLDMFIFEKVCRQMAEWRAAGYELLPISSNFSRLHGRNSSFTEDILRIAGKYDIPSELLELEVTETVAMSLDDGIAKFADQLSALGFRLAIDDFGTGYSSLAVLDQLKIDVLKLDRNFFVGGIENKVRLTIIKKLVELAHEIDIEVVCEGIETDEQENILKAIGCEIAQGFRYARPETAEDFTKKLHKI